jgi:hypothetical protein
MLEGMRWKRVDIHSLPQAQSDLSSLFSLSLSTPITNVTVGLLALLVGVGLVTACSRAGRSFRLDKCVIVDVSAGTERVVAAVGLKGAGLRRQALDITELWSPKR